MAINVVCVQYNGGSLIDIILLTQGYTTTIIGEPILNVTLVFLACETTILYTT